MIFNCEFDKSLWLMIKGDIKNRRKIVDFVKSIPYDFILSIRDSLIEYDKYKIENVGISFDDREYRCFDKQMYNNVGELYSFNIDVRKDTLSIARSIYVMGLGTYYKDFSIELVNINKDLNLSKINDIGKVCYLMNGVNDLKKIGYGIMDIGLSNVLMSSLNNDIYRFCGFVNVDKDINLELDSKLIRIRKKNSGDDKINV